MTDLTKIQSELKAPKSQFNKFGNFFYRKAEDIAEAVKPLLVKYGCQLTLTDDIKLLDGRYYVEAVATFIDSGGAVTQVKAYAREEDVKKGMDAAQITGGCSSYARKYALGGLFLLDDNLEPDDNKGQEPTPPPVANAPAPKPKGRPANPPQPASQASENVAKLNQIGLGEQLAEAKALLALAVTEKRVSESEPLGIVDIFNSYPQLKDNKEFIAACRKRKEQILNG